MDLDANLIAAALLSGGLVGGFGAFINARTKARQARVQERRLEQKAPLEMSAMILDGSENAMVMMEQVNTRLEAENVRLRAENERKEVENLRLHDRIHTLETNLDAVQMQLLNAHALAGRLASTLDEVQRQYDATRRELEDLRDTDS